MTSFAGRRVLLDANLLLLLLIGSIDRSLFDTNKRIRKYSAREFFLLNECLREAKVLMTTGHVNSQASDLGAGSLTGQYRQTFLDLLRAMHENNTALLMTADEVHQPILSLNASVLRELGVADAGLINATRESSGVLFTDDLPLYLMAQRHGVEAVNFSHLLQ